MGDMRKFGTKGKQYGMAMALREKHRDFLSMTNICRSILGRVGPNLENNSIKFFSLSRIDERGVSILSVNKVIRQGDGPIVTQCICGDRVSKLGSEGMQLAGHPARIGVAATAAAGAKTEDWRRAPLLVISTTVGRGFIAGRSIVTSKAPSRRQATDR